MTLSKIYTVWCDIEFCGSWTGEEMTGPQARIWAQQGGWKRMLPAEAPATVQPDLLTRLTKIDVCPKHGALT